MVFRHIVGELLYLFVHPDYGLGHALEAGIGELQYLQERHFVTNYYHPAKIVS
jgi:hypothetical protein